MNTLKSRKCDGNHGGPPCLDPNCWNDCDPVLERNILEQLDTFQHTTFEWSAKQFGVRGPKGPLNHLKSECDEMIAAPDDIEEFADGFLLLQDAASRAGHKMSDVYIAALKKHVVNEAREWGEVNEQGFTEHVK